MSVAISDLITLTLSTVNALIVNAKSPEILVHVRPVYICRKNFFDVGTENFAYEGP